MMWKLVPTFLFNKHFGLGRKSSLAFIYDTVFWNNIFPFLKPCFYSDASRPVVGFKRLPIQYVLGLFTLGWSGQSMKLTTLLHLLPRLSIRDCLPSLLNTLLVWILRHWNQITLLFYYLCEGIYHSCVSAIQNLTYTTISYSEIAQYTSQRAARTYCH
jgi:hypothetical protein